MIVVVAIRDVADEDRRGEEVVGRDVEEALDLPGMEVDGQHPVGAGRVIMLATSLAEIGVRASDFRSCRA